MKVQIERISPHKTALVLTGVYFAIAIPFMLLVGLPALLLLDTPQMGELGNGPFRLPAIYFILAPFLYAIGAYIFTAIFCLLYNLAARFLGGMELTMAEVSDR